MVSKITPNQNTKLIKFYRLIIIFIGITIIFSSCTQSEKIDVSNIKVNIDIRRMDEELMKLSNIADIQAFIKANPAYFINFYQLTSANDTAFINNFDRMLNHPDSKIFQQQSYDTFGDLADLKTQFETAFKHIKYYYPEFKEPKIITTFSGLEKDIYVSDSMIVVSLEGFIGKKAKYRFDMPDYILRRYEKPYIVPTVVKFMSQKYNKANPSDNTMLADMIYYGKSFEFTREMLPDVADSLIIAYPDSAIQKTWVAQDLIWAHFIDKKLLYESDLKIKTKYLDERPITTDVGPECPGRIGQWVGWRIVNLYRTENGEVTLQDLMKNPNAQEILQKSKYKGQSE
jgi:gliding motility-associated lipoprotein GldB